MIYLLCRSCRNKRFWPKQVDHKAKPSKTPKTDFSKDVVFWEGFASWSTYPFLLKFLFCAPYDNCGSRNAREIMRIGFRGLNLMIYLGFFFCGFGLFLFGFCFYVFVCSVLGSQALGWLGAQTAAHHLTLPICCGFCVYCQVLALEGLGWCGGHSGAQIAWFLVIFVLPSASPEEEQQEKGNERREEKRK